MSILFKAVHPAVQHEAARQDAQGRLHGPREPILALPHPPEPHDPTEPLQLLLQPQPDHLGSLVLILVFNVKCALKIH